MQSSTCRTRSTWDRNCPPVSETALRRSAPSFAWPPVAGAGAVAVHAHLGSKARSGRGQARSGIAKSPDSVGSWSWSWPWTTEHRAQTAHHTALGGDAPCQVSVPLAGRAGMTAHCIIWDEMFGNLVIWDSTGQDVQCLSCCPLGEWKSPSCGELHLRRRSEHTSAGGDMHIVENGLCRRGIAALAALAVVALGRVSRRVSRRVRWSTVLWPGSTPEPQSPPTALCGSAESASRLSQPVR